MAMRLVPKRSMMKGSDSMFIGKLSVTIKLAKAPELSKGKNIKTKIRVSDAAVFFKIHAPANDINIFFQ
jgi:hypothetical protein